MDPIVKTTTQTTTACNSASLKPTKEKRNEVADKVRDILVNNKIEKVKVETIDPLPFVYIWVEPGNKNLVKEVNDCLKANGLNEIKYGSYFISDGVKIFIVEDLPEIRPVFL